MRRRFAQYENFDRRRLTYYLVKAPYSVTEIGDFIFLSGRKFPRNRRFLDHSSKTGSDGAERFRVKSYVPLALSNGTWLRAVGLPVWAGHRRPCFFVSGNFARGYRPQFLRYRYEILQVHCPRGHLKSVQKFWGSDPLGEIFSQNFFSRYRSENLRV